MWPIRRHQAPRRQHHSVVLKDLHWLPVRDRVDYKIAVLCHKAVKLQQPSYLTCLLSPYRQSCVLRSSTPYLLSTPTLWNSLLSFVRTADSFTSFRSQLKTYLYIQLYSPKMLAIRKQNKNLTNLTKMLRNSPQFTTIIQYTEHHHTHTAVYNIDCHTNDNYLEIY